ncbi:unnamed protein product [Miscanthus lutarioriparius]|uniref:Uncharacterized protein n=1 Tax=Miscanthus lutarioriparius TaxID=422564 RepID=A0A811Q397_9POAL|nr:unnamed protein product [Miscanthus lutarioriparius]
MGVQGNDVVLDFSGCSALESLWMEECLVSSTEMHSPSLKHLRIKYCFFYSNYRTRVWFPNLRSFDFITNFGRAPMLERMPYLEAAKVRFDHHYDDRCKNGRLDDCGSAACRGCFNYYGPDDSGSVFLEGLAEATYLNLSAYPDMYVFNRDLEWWPAFNKLKTLVLSKWFLSTELSALIWFLHHTPLLEKLTLKISKVIILCVLITTPIRSEKYLAIDDPSRLLKQPDAKTANRFHCRATYMNTKQRRYMVNDLDGGDGRSGVMGRSDVRSCLLVTGLTTLWRLSRFVLSWHISSRAFCVAN